MKENFPDALKLQLIPEDQSLWFLDKYEDFLKVRRKILADEMNKFLNSISRTVEAEIILGIDDLLEIGETDYIEAKATFQVDKTEHVASEEYRDAILKAIAAFANADGGNVLIGVNKEGEILGLEDDYNVFEGNSILFKDCIQNLLELNFKDLKNKGLISVKYHNYSEKEICQIEISKSDEPIFLNLKDKYGIQKEVFCVRNGIDTEELPKDRTINYIRQRFEVFK